ncbi:MAG: response regulator [Bacteroidales bacterium]|nr:response regulator [Bacteroidales bacterium]
MNLYKSVIEKSTVNEINHNFKILVVEDDDVGYMLLHEILSSYPVTLVRAFNGEEAIDNFQNDKSAFSLVLMDIRLPKVNGYEATRKIKEINPSIPVIAVTAYAHSQGVIDCFNSGCDDFISKPFDINKIFRIIENYLVIRN